jgi:multiple sugar transport system permease protein
VHRQRTIIVVLNWGAVQAGVAVMTIPCLIIFLLLQRYYMRGLMAGAVK